MEIAESIKRSYLLGKTKNSTLSFDKVLFLGGEGGLPVKNSLIVSMLKKRKIAIE
ncbi:hypothetical protein [Agathobaculum sp.]|uniref:hypothetical protein n=1 Tax=Agathobaculum sp. TaxID=2048138 RepID=UPI002A8168DD|nr:hypothetical protein [Agathobaculum sp.]MDY3618785.1 hypothetical protein [Agathobaculum sp.]